MSMIFYQTLAERRNESKTS